MSDYKGVGVVFVRNALTNAGGDALARVREGLDEEERTAFDRTMATDWVPIELITKLFVLSAPILFPGKPNPLREVGAELARDNLRGVYRYLVRVMTVPFVIDQAAKLWRSYHKHGSASVVAYGEHAISLMVQGYPRLPERFRECMCGYIVGTLELAGAKNVAVAKSEDDPNAWEFRIAWK